ncbi:MAG: toll/interleukin-1 receptor domain-containing protein [Thiolinea sp.]
MTKKTVFVSYSRKDGSQVEKAVELLEAGGADVFRDIDDIEFGDRWEDVIRSKLAEAERVLVFWSKHAQVSEWVQREWSIALTMQKRIVPILLDQTPLPTELGQFHALSNFILAAPNTMASQTAKSTLRWGFLVGGLGVALVLGFTVLNLNNTADLTQTIPSLDDSASSAVGAGNQPSTANNQGSADSTQGDLVEPLTEADGSKGTVATAPIAPKPAPQVVAPVPIQPELQKDHSYWLGLSIFLALLAIISYLVWTRRQHSKQIQTGEQFIKEIFQE